jgi:hypothetical protein
MNASNFVRLVREMRKAQKAYFKQRLSGDLATSKRLEGQVDQALEDGIVGVDEEVVMSPAVYAEQMALMEEAGRDEATDE